MMTRQATQQVRDEGRSASPVFRGEGVLMDLSGKVSPVFRGDHLKDSEPSPLFGGEGLFDSCCEQEHFPYSVKMRLWPEGLSPVLMAFVIALSSMAFGYCEAIPPKASWNCPTEQLKTVPAPAQRGLAADSEESSPMPPDTQFVRRPTMPLKVSEGCMAL